VILFLPQGCLAGVSCSSHDHTYRVRDGCTALIINYLKMAYQVLARKWRPLSFEDVVNQEHVKKTLINAIQSNRIAHSYIFAGPRGVGKTTVARILARTVNCEQGPTPTPCNSCVPCREIIEDRSMDVMEIDGASNRGIEDVRNIRENVKYAPVHGKYRVYIIDEVHMLTREAFNALLKTLEEPPAHVLFIFATTELQKIPATILSRCQRFDFKRIAISEIVSQLQKIAAAEKISISDEAQLFLAKRSEGSMRDAESLLDQLISFCGTTISADDIFDVLGMIREDIYFSCSDAVKSGDMKEGFIIARKIFDDGYDPGEFVNGLLEHYRNMLITSLAGNAGMVDTTEPFKKQYEQSVENFSDEDLLRIINVISESEYGIKQSAQPLLRLEMLLAKLTSLDRSVSIEQVLRAIDTNGNYKTPGPDNDVNEGGTEMTAESKTADLSPNPPDPVIQKNVKEVGTEKTPAKNGNGQTDRNEQDKTSDHGTKLDLTMIRERWNEFVDMVRKESAVTGTFLEEGTPTQFEENVMHIAFRPEFEFNIISLERNRVKVNGFIERMFGPNIGFNCVKIKLTEEEKKQTENSSMHVSIHERIKKIIDREPIIQTIIEKFGAKSIKLMQD
jgi:DNA polymerase-3 subunit gamma/tau